MIFAERKPRENRVKLGTVVADEQKSSLWELFLTVNPESDTDKHGRNRRRISQQKSKKLALLVIDLVSVRKQTANAYKYEKESEQTDYSENHKQNPEQNLQENHIIPLLQKKYRWALSPAFWNVRLPRC